MTELTDEAVKSLLAHYELPTDCDCDDDDCVKCSHYPTFQERASKQLKDAAPDLARALIDARAERDRLRATLEKRNEEIVLERDISAGLSAKLHATGFIEAPTEPGSFIGDIWFGHSIKRTMGTHRWTGSEWTALPSEMDAVLDLLAMARAEIATLKGPTNG